jgi:hypothetical protein
MKKTDIAMIVFIASLSILVSYFVAKSVLGDARPQSVTVKTAEEIKSDITPPDPTVFNTSAINPTVEVFIGNGQ